MSNVTIFLCGDVMTGRGIDQILPHPSAPTIHERYVESAVDYVKLAEAVNGPIARPSDFAYIWGDALLEFDRFKPDLKLINLETAVTRSEDFFPKGINYRMNPANINCLVAAGIHCCSLANNHVLDWSYEGLHETLETLGNAGIRATGAGQNQETAESPAIFRQDNGTISVFGLGSVSSGIPGNWAAKQDMPGIALVEDYSPKTVEVVASRIERVKVPGMIVIVSIHWGPNWGYRIDREEREFAHHLIDKAGVDIIHGHSSHHVKGIEVYHDKLILYGCGDFINDYEGIGGYEQYRADLGLMYFATLDTHNGDLESFEMVPTQVKRFRVNRAGEKEAKLLNEVLDRESRKLGSNVRLSERNTLNLAWIR